MTADQFAAFALFAFVSSITPGPNNTMLMASGANFGLRRTFPHMLGVALGFGAMVILAGAALGGLLRAFPAAHTVLTVVGAAYLLWLAYKLATAHGVGGGKAAGKPLTFTQAALFQWVNPKALAMAFTAITTYAPRAPTFGDIVVIGLVFAVINLPSVGVWAGFGTVLRRWLDRPRALKAFNLTMAALLVASLYPAAMELLGVIRR